MNTKPAKSRDVYPLYDAEVRELRDNGFILEEVKHYRVLRVPINQIEILEKIRKRRNYEN